MILDRRIQNHERDRFLTWRMMVSENRFTLFGIMRLMRRTRPIAGRADVKG